MQRETRISWHQGRAAQAALRRERYTGGDLARAAKRSRAFISLWLAGRAGSDAVAQALGKLLPEWCREHLPELWHSVAETSSAKQQVAESAEQ